jgi:6-phosphofructokinase
VLGASAVAYLLAGRSNAMVGVQNGQVCLVPFQKVIGKKKKLDLNLLGFAQDLAI